MVEVTRDRSCDYDVSEYLFGASRNQIVGALSCAELLLDLDQQVQPVNHQLDELALHKKQQQNNYFIKIFLKVMNAKGSIL